MTAVRGYVFSRSFMGERVPQHVQNIVIRDYCSKRNLIFLLSATEYAMPNCHLMMQNLLAELDAIDGVVAYSLFQLPSDVNQRAELINTFIQKEKTLHLAVEGLTISTQTDADRVDAIWSVRQVMDEEKSEVKRWDS